MINKVWKERSLYSNGQAIPPMSTKRTTTSHRNLLNTKKVTTTYDVKDPGHGLGQALTCGGLMLALPLGIYTDHIMDSCTRCVFLTTMIGLMLPVWLSCNL